MNYIIFDLEWNQSPSGKTYSNKNLPFEIVEIGAVKLNSCFKEVGRFSELVRPRVYKNINYIIGNIIHIREEELKKARPFKEVMESFLQFCGTNYIFCTWGNLDLLELQRNMKYFGMKPLSEGPICFIDVQKVFALQTEGKKYQHTLEYAVDYCRIKKDVSFHRAFADAYYTSRILSRIKRKYRKKLSFDTYCIPQSKEEEVRITFDSYYKYISRGFTRPKDILIGCVAQFTVMPLLAFALGKIFGLDAALLAGVILVGTCPGGTSSNVITYLSKGDVALSVGMTSVNTLLAPLLTPAITYLLLRTTVTVDPISMFLSIIKVVIIPIALGFIINKLFGKVTQKLVKVLPTISVIAICLIVAAVVSHNSEKIMTTGLVVFAVVILHNLLGYACGFGIGRLLHMSVPKTKAISIEIGMQNSGLATSLAGTAFPDLAMATVPGAIFSVWHNISGAILANVYNRWTEKNETK